MLSPAALALGLFASPSRRVATLAATALSAAARRRRLGVKRAGRESFRERSGPGGTRKVFRRSRLILSGGMPSSGDARTARPQASPPVSWPPRP